MAVTSSSAKSGEKEIKTKWPFTSGTSLGTTKIEGRQINLTPAGIHGVKTTVLKADRAGISDEGL